MDHIEIILKNIKKSKIEDVLCSNIIFDNQDIISSHFFDNEIDADVEYQDIRSLKSYFNVPGTCNMYLKKVMFGTELKNVLILIAFDENYGEITIDFEEEQLEKYSNEELKVELRAFMILLLKIYQEYEIEEIILGYEPAEDADMKILEISQKKIKIFNNNIFTTLIAKDIFHIAKEMKV